MKKINNKIKKYLHKKTLPINIENMELNLNSKNAPHTNSESLLLNEESRKEVGNYKYDRAVKMSFYITYAFLMTTATITFIESISTKIPRIRHILNLETCISVVATFFYTQFIKKLKLTETGMNPIAEEVKVNYKSINLTRYTDWAITTPIMLLVLLLVFCYNTKQELKASFFLVVLILNYLMLYIGFLGEKQKMTRINATIWGFVFFFGLYGLIYAKYLHGNYNFDNQIIFWAFVFFWAFYGVLYNYDEEKKNIGYNVLDLFSKCFVGIFFWAYLTKVLVIF